MDEQFAEHALGREEAAISDMLNELNKDISKIHVIANKSKMIIFLHSLTYRTKKFRDQTEPKPEKKTSLLRKLDEKKKECAERDAKQQTVKKKRNYEMSL